MSAATSRRTGSRSRVPTTPSTLSGDAKDALAREVPAEEHCRSALLAGLALYGVPAGGTAFRTQRAAVARLFWSLLGSGERHAIRKVRATRLHRAATYEIAAEAGAPPRRYAARCDRRMELRAAFLACGSLAEPARGYHLEFVPPNPASAARLLTQLRGDGHEPRHATRKQRDLVYFKDLDAIVGVLSAIGAYGAVLHLEDVRAFKDTKNRIHRLVNTEAANVERAASAAALQRDSIAFLADVHGLRRLSPALREVAELRLRHPAETLAELGAHCRPPAKKSTVNGRMSALLRLARRLGSEPSGSAASRKR
jgi:DNA-binding transcriptional regulator WhiA